MKTKSFFLIIAFFLSASPRQNLTAATVLDSFSSGSFNLSDDGLNTNIEIITDDLLDRRRTIADSTGDFTAILTPDSGLMSYTVSLRAAPIGRDLLILSYSNQDNSAFNLLGATGFTLDVTGLLGSGEVLISMDASARFSTPIPITSTGVFFYPLANAGPPLPLDSMHHINIQLIATSADFSITLDRISVVPEPSTGLLLGLGGWFMIVKRRALRRPESGRPILPKPAKN